MASSKIRIRGIDIRSDVESVIACSAIAVLLMLSGVCMAADVWDFNPGQTAVKYQYEQQESVEGIGYVRHYQNVETNNLSMLEYMHGSGSFKEADLISAAQKTVGTKEVDEYYIIDSKTGLWKTKSRGKNSYISFTKQNDVTQAPFRFAFGSGWYSANPVGYDSLFKDRTEAKSYQEASSMVHQVEYARGYVGDITVDLNCTGPTFFNNGVGLTSMKIKDQVIDGTVHVGVLQTYTLYKAQDDMKIQGMKKPLVFIDNDYVGTFNIEKSMKLNIVKSKSKSAADWLPCCSGGFFDIPDYEWNRGGQIGIFDCTCRNTSISTFKPKWDGASAQFPEEVYKLVP